MREDRDLAGVNDRACGCEELRSGPLRAEDMRLEARIEVPDQLGERRGRAAELRAMVDVEDRDPVARRQDLVVDRLDPPSVAGGVEVLLGVCASGSAERLAALSVLEQLGDRVRQRFDAVVRDEHSGFAGDDNAAARARARRHDWDAARRGLDHGAAELGALRRGDDDIGRLVQVGRVLGERNEPDDVVELELAHELLGLGLVIARQVGKLQRAADDGAEELLAADGAADDEVAGVDAALAQARRRLDELAEALGRVDEAEERHDRQIGRKPERRARGCRVAGAEALQVDRVRNDRRADAEDLGDVAVDRDRRRREVSDRLPDQARAAVAALLRQRRTKVPDDRQARAPGEPRGRDQRRVVEVDEAEALTAQRVPELPRVARQAGELSTEEQPAAAAVGRGPDVREACDGAGVDDRARLPEEVGGGSPRAVHVRLEARPVELADQVRQRLGSTAELAPVVDEENRDRKRLPGHRPMLAGRPAGLRFPHRPPEARGRSSPR